MSVLLVSTSVSFYYSLSQADMYPCEGPRSGVFIDILVGSVCFLERYDMADKMQNNVKMVIDLHSKHAMYP
jgi:hypothetical protein